MISRKVITYLLLMAVLIGSVPYLMGLWVQQSYLEILTTIADLKGFSIQPVSYKVGWLKSEAVNKVVFPNITVADLNEFIQDQTDQPQSDQKTKDLLQEHKKKPFTLTLKHNVLHGPIVYSSRDEKWQFKQALITSKLSLSDKAKALLSQIFSDINLLEANTSINPNGSTNIILFGAPIKYKTDPKVTSDLDDALWQGFNADLNINRNLDKLRANFVCPGFNMQFEDTTYQAEDLSFNTVQTKYENDIWLGNFTFFAQNFNTLNFNPESKQKINLNLNAVSIGSKDRLIENNIANITSLRIEKIQFGDAVFGPMAAQFKSADLPAKALKDFGYIEFDDFNYQAILSNEKIKNALEEILKARPKLSVQDLFIYSGDDRLTLNMDFAIGGKNASTIKNQKQIINSINFEMNMRVPKPMLETLITVPYSGFFDLHNNLDDEQLTKEDLAKVVQDQIDFYLQEGWLKQDRNYFITDLKYSNGKLLLNGKQ